MANLCKISAGLEALCVGMTKGGLKGTIYVANYSEIAGYTISNKVVSAITMEVDPLTTNPYFFYKIAFKNSTAGFVNEMQGTNNNYAKQSLSFAVEGLSAPTLVALEDMMVSDLVFVVVDARGDSHLLGRLEGMTRETATIGTGTAADDMYGSNLVFSSEEAELSNTIQTGTTIEVFDEVTSTVITVTLP